MLARDEFGAHIKQLRARAGLTQAVAARAAGVNAKTWARWENGGMPYVTRAPDIARALGIPLLALLEPDNGRVAVADLTISAEALERVKRNGTPELERLAATLARQVTARIATLAAAPPHKEKGATVRWARPVARDVRVRLDAHHRRRALP